MSLVKTRLKRKTNEGADTIYIETLSSMVMRDSGSSVEDDLSAVEEAVENKVGITGFGTDNGVLAEFDGNGNIKASSVSSTEITSIITHTNNTSNPHSVTAAQVGAYTSSQTDTAIATAKEEAVSEANSNTGVVADTYGLTANATPSYNDTFTVPKFTVNAAGKITSAGNHTVKIPNAPAVTLSNGATGTSTISGDTVTVNVTSIDATKLSGIIPINSIPKAAVSELKVVTNENAMLALTSNDVQTGDVVKLNSTGVMYYVADDTLLGTSAAFEEFKAGLATSVAWSDVTGKPETYTPSSHNHTITDITNFPDIPAATDTTPLAAGTASTGISEEYARADHVHPLQTSVSGNAGTATEFSTTKNVTLTGDVTGTASSTAGWTVNTTLADSGVTANDYGPANNSTLDEGETFSVPYITVDSKGRITAASTKTLTLPTHTDPEIVDEKVEYNSTNANAKLNVSLVPSGTVSGNIAKASFAGTKPLTYNPYTGNLEATKFNNHTIESDIPSNAVFTDTTYTPSDTTPVADSTNGAAGIATTYSRGDHSHPSDDTKLNVNEPVARTSLTLFKNSDTKTIKSKICKNASESIDYGTQIIDYNTDDVDNYTRLIIRNSLAANGIENSIYLSNTDENNNGTVYKIYGEHNKPTPADIGAAAASHGTHVTYSNTAPSANGTASAGSASTVARSDHVHPEQTDISGNAGTATKLANNINIGLSGVTATSQTFDGSGDITIPVTEVPVSIVTGLAAVATTGSYNDLTNKPTIPVATTTTPKANGTASVGSETKWAKGDHIHPLQTSVSGNAGTATKLANGVNIGLSGVTATPQNFDGSSEITIPITAVPTSIITGLASVATTGSYNDLTNKPTIPTAATDSPNAAGIAAVGSSTKYAKEDHVHPAQTDVSGNAGTATTLKNSQNFTITNGTYIPSGSSTAVANTTTAVSFDGSTGVDLQLTRIDGKTIVGTIPLESIPAGARENLIIVANQTARYALTTSTVQLGDVIKETDTGLMYYVVDEANLSNANGYVEFTAGTAAAVPWSGVTDKPSTFTPASHVHGNITNDGAITADTDVANGDKIIVADSSNSSKLIRTAITFDGSTETKALTPKGTWVTFNNYSHPTATATTAAAVKVGNDASGHVVIGAALTASDVGAAPTSHSHFTGTATNNQVVIADTGTTGGIKTSGYTIAASVPSGAKFTDNSVTAVGNHYTPSGGTEVSYPATALTGINFIDQISITKDAAGHITAVSTTNHALTKSDITGLGIPSSDTNTHYISKNIVGASSTATANAAVTSNGVYMNHLEESTVKSTHKISGAGATKVTADSSGNITIRSIDFNSGTSQPTGQQNGDYWFETLT